MAVSIAECNFSVHAGSARSEISPEINILEYGIKNAYKTLP